MFWQVLLVLGFTLGLGWFGANIVANLERSRLEFGLGFLFEPSKFYMGPNPLGYEPSDTVLEAFAAGVANTIRVSLLSIVLTTFLGTLLALMRLSRNWLISQLAWTYVEVIRNIPLLLQILFWYSYLTLWLPNVRNSWNPLTGVYLNTKGLNLPSLTVSGGLPIAVVSALFGIGVAWVVWRWSRGVRAGSRGWRLPIAALAAVLPIVSFLALGGNVSLNEPELQGLSFRGGLWVSPEFAALLFALTIYQSAFAAETIRSGILGVGKGQVEAARGLGLKPVIVFGTVVLPQALRIIVPPMTSQYLSLTKQSSLAVVIGYPDVVRVSTAVTSDTGRALECIAIIMAVYLSLSLLTSLFMNWYNRRITFAEGS